MNELEYYTFVLGRDLLVKKLENIENDVAFDICSKIANLFLKSTEFVDFKYSGYESLENFLHNNYDVIAVIICDIKYGQNVDIYQDLNDNKYYTAQGLRNLLIKDELHDIYNNIDMYQKKELDIDFKFEELKEIKSICIEEVQKRLKSYWCYNFNKIEL